MASPTLARRLGLTGNRGCKAPVRAATTANITLSGEQTVGGVAVVSGDRVLVWNQTSSINNGIYDVSTGTWTRSIDANGTQDWSSCTIGVVSEGTYAAQFWILSTIGTIIPDTSAMVFQVGMPTLPILAAASGSSFIGFLQAGVGAVLRTLQSKARETVSVKDFGAVCDGITDDWAAIQAAQEYLKANGGGTLIFPGWCLINAPFYFYGSVNNGWITNPAYPNPNQPQITWRSNSQGGIRAGSMTSGDLLRFSNPNTSAALLYTVGFKDFVIDCVQKNITAINGQAYDGSAGSGAGANHYIDVHGLVIQGIQGANAIGLDLGSITDSKVIACHVQGWGSGPYGGIRVNKTDVQLIDCRLSYCIKGIVVGVQTEACIQMFGGCVQSPKEHCFYWESPSADTKSSASVITGAFLGETQGTAVSGSGPIMGAASPSNLDICTITFVGCVFDNWTASTNLANITWAGNFTFIGCSAWYLSTGSKSIKFGASCNATWLNNKTISVDSTGAAVALGQVKEALTYAQNVSYVPALAATGSTFAYVANGQKGYYTKIGNTVTVTARMQLAAAGNTLTANNLSLSLPLAAANNTFQEVVCAVGVFGATSNLYGAMGLITAGAQQINLYKTAAAQASFYSAPLLANDLSGVSGASGIQVTVTYFTPY